MGTLASKPQHQPTRPIRTLSDDLATYREFLNCKDPCTKFMRAAIKQRLEDEPVTETDVQNIWALQSPEWIEAALANIAKFNLLNKQPTGGYIDLFIETEMLACPSKEVEWMVEVWEGYRRAKREEVEAQLAAGAVEAVAVASGGRGNRGRRRRVWSRFWRR